jgi:outer membrane protein insertion porin family
MTRSPHRRMTWIRWIQLVALLCLAVLGVGNVSTQPVLAQYPGQVAPSNYGANPYLNQGAPAAAPAPAYTAPNYTAPSYPATNYATAPPAYPTATPNFGHPSYSPVPPAANTGMASPNPYLQSGPTTTYQPGTAGFGPPPLPAGAPPSGVPMIHPNASPFNPPTVFDTAPEYLQPAPNTTPLDVYVEETRTGRFMFGVAVNSDAGVTGQITIDERNFDISRPPTSWDDFANGTAWRGAGQGFRIEAQPGNQVQRYMVSFTEPYFLNSNVSFSASAFYFDRGYYDWAETRYGGRLAWGYRLTPDLSVTSSIRAENVEVFAPRVLTVPELNAALGKSDVFSGKISLMHDTRDLPFMPTEGHLLEMSYEQAFGDFDFPRGEIEYFQYFLISERPDRSGRHTLAFSTRLGVTGAQTPIFENYFAGGFSTIRGYSFRGASPVENTVRVGGQLRWLNSVEYFFPLTADDMVKGTVFVDFGTVERDIALHGGNFRVAPGFGFRINVPALGPAPLALDFSFPVHSAPGDDEQMFSFFFGLSRQ